ncbi:MAG: hypothetical protein A2231_06370 [Candidatus Firestonebacteria bacterium RIFOXYA2_FULL_40_8]|nr:MAG: hypothetical protein A2231_06370 [Candidatus Firestonebacteria bacterium RIFOXYA2_FULL_40_8]
MPIYEYKCAKCGNLFEVLQNKNIKSEKCEKCGTKALRVPASRVGFVFKGSGFYVNDYGKKTETRGQKSEGGGTGKTEDQGQKTVAGAGKTEGGKKDGGTEARKDRSTESTKTEKKTESKSEKKESKG